MNEMKEVLEPRVYEVGFHILPTITEEKLFEVTDAFKKKLGLLGGLPISEEAPTLLDLAYSMDKVIENKRIAFSRAYFGTIKFDLVPDVVIELDSYLKAHEHVLRYIIFSTVREDTRIPKKFLKSSGKRETREGRKGTDDSRNVDPITEMGAPLDENKGDIALEVVAQNDVIVDEALLESKIDDLVAGE